MSSEQINDDDDDDNNDDSLLTNIDNRFAQR